MCQPIALIGLSLLAAITRAGSPEAMTLGKSVEGRAIVARVWGEAERTLLIIASIHGSEPAGTPLVERLEGWLADRPEELVDRRVVIVPVVNPDGYAKRERHNANGVDLNRNYPTDNRTERKIHGESALSEPESRALLRAVQIFDPVRVVSLHQPIDCLDYDGPGAALAQAMSEAIDGRLPVKKLGGRPGSFGSYVGITLGRPIITMELPEDAEKRSAEALWDDYGAALVAFLHAD